MMLVVDLLVVIARGVVSLVFDLDPLWKPHDLPQDIANALHCVNIIRIAVPHGNNVFIVTTRNYRTTNFVPD
jgi:hypothetical protein